MSKMERSIRLTHQEREEESDYGRYLRELTNL